MKVTATDDTSHAVKVTLDGNTADVSAGGSQSVGSVSLIDATGKRKVHILGGAAPLVVATAPGAGTPENVIINGSSGIVSLGNDTAVDPTIILDGAGHSLTLHDDTYVQRIGLDGAKGIVTLSSDKGKARVVLDATIGYGAFGGDGWDGGLGIFPTTATNLKDGGQATIFMNGQAATLSLGASPSTVTLDGKAAALRLGGASKNGSIVILGANGQASIQIDAATGDITLLNADCAEDFDLAGTEDLGIEPGTVVVLDDDGRIRTCREAYDSRVAGVLSGAGGYRPGLRLDHRVTGHERRPVALMGKVFCKADASYGPIRAGDLLTTSPTPGHAMTMRDKARAVGTILGKALKPIDKGQMLIPILVTLQ